MTTPTDPHALHASSHLTPRDISGQTFPSKVSGYDKAAVRAYLETAARRVEDLLREQRTLSERCAGLERELAQKKEAEDEIRRVIVSAERMAQDLRESAAREAELLIEGARLREREWEGGHERRMAEADRQHQDRLGELEIAFRSRHAELERDHHDRILAREREHAERLAELERQFAGRYHELTGRLTEARQEYGQFLSGYRALLRSFGELSGRHALPGDAAHLPALESFSAPATTPVGEDLYLPQEQTWTLPESSHLTDLPPELAAALFGAAPELAQVPEVPAGKDARSVHKGSAEERTVGVLSGAEQTEP